MRCSTSISGAPGRLGSRSRAAKARESGKVFVNGAEVGRKGNSPATQRRRRGSRLGRSSGKRQAARGAVHLRPLAHPLRGCFPHRAEQACRPARGAARAAQRRGVDLRPDRRSHAIAWQAEAARGPSHRSRHVGSGAVRQGRPHPGRASRASSGHAHRSASTLPWCTDIRIRRAESGATTWCGIPRR